MQDNPRMVFVLPPPRRGKVWKSASLILYACFSDSPQRETVGRWVCSIDKSRMVFLPLLDTVCSKKLHGNKNIPSKSPDFSLQKTHSVQKDAFSDRPKKVPTRPAQKNIFEHPPPPLPTYKDIWRDLLLLLKKKIQETAAASYSVKPSFSPDLIQFLPFLPSTDDRNAVKVNVSFPFFFRRRRRRISPKFGAEKKKFFPFCERFSLERKKKRERRIGGQKKAWRRANWNNETDS